MAKVLGLITARGGSQGVPRKNIRPLNGKPLLQYAAESALAARLLSRVVLSTDDAEIARIGKNCGLEVPFMRPAELALDTTPSLPVVLHALSTLEESGEFYDAVCLLQPTNPLRRAGDIDDCVKMLFSTNADAVVSVLPVPTEYNPHWVFEQRGENLALATGESFPIARRQDLPTAFHRDGSIYVTRRRTLLKGSLYGENLRGFPIDRNFSANIDTEDDWQNVEQRMKGRAARI